MIIRTSFLWLISEVLLCDGDLHGFSRDAGLEL